MLLLVIDKSETARPAFSAKQNQTRPSQGDVNMSLEKELGDKLVSVPVTSGLVSRGIDVTSHG